MISFPDFSPQNFYQLGVMGSSRVHLLPPPRVSSISPAFGPRSGSTWITISGQSFRVPSYEEKLSVLVGGADCPVLSWSVNRIVCITPPGADEQQVDLLLVSQLGEFTRRTGGGASFFFLDVFMAYSLPQSDQSSLLSFSQGRRLLALGNISLPGRINAVQLFGQQLFVGGTFRNVAARDGTANHLVMWDGNALSHLGLGLDGAISTMSVVNSFLVVGGTFSTVYMVTPVPPLPYLTHSLFLVLFSLLILLSLLLLSSRFSPASSDLKRRLRGEHGDVEDSPSGTEPPGLAWGARRLMGM